jgi:hypothetical protein
MDRLHDRGMVSAEYSVGTLGAVLIATVLYKLGILNDHNPWLDSFRDLLKRSLEWGALRDLVPTLFGLRF